MSNFFDDDDEAEAEAEDDDAEEDDDEDDSKWSPFCFLVRLVISQQIESEATSLRKTLFLT